MTCNDCRFFGGYQSDTEPPGRCAKNAPGSYHHVRRKEYVSESMFALALIETPFPGVWPEQSCGEYQPRGDQPAIVDAT